MLHQGPRKPVHLRATNNFDTDESASTWKWLSRLHAFPDARAKSDARHDARRALARGMRRPVPLLRLLAARQREMAAGCAAPAFFPRSCSSGTSYIDSQRGSAGKFGI